MQLWTRDVMLPLLQPGAARRGRSRLASVVQSLLAKLPPRDPRREGRRGAREAPDARLGPRKVELHSTSASRWGARAVAPERFNAQRYRNPDLGVRCESTGARVAGAARADARRRTD